MTDEERKALVEALRGDWPEILVEKHWMMDSDAIDKQRTEAAAQIEADGQRIAELEAALRGVTPTTYFGEDEPTKAYWAKARAALGVDTV